MYRLLLRLRRRFFSEGFRTVFYENVIFSVFNQCEMQIEISHVVGHRFLLTSPYLNPTAGPLSGTLICEYFVKYIDNLGVSVSLPGDLQSWRKERRRFL